MDRLLQFFLKTFIRRGTFRLTTSRGTKIVFGDGTGKPVAVRFATRAAEWGILLDPELRLGEAYMDGSFVVEQSSIADVLAVVFGQDRTQAFQNGPNRPLNYRFDECSCPAQPSLAPSGELFSLSDVVATAKETNHG